VNRFTQYYHAESNFDKLRAHPIFPAAALIESGMEEELIEVLENLISPQLGKD